MTLSKSQVKLLSIREFAQVCRTTPRTLRFYDQKGLFKPAKVDKWNKYRFYDPKQARDFLKIRLLQNFHIPLRQIKEHVPKRTENLLENRLKAVKEEIGEKGKEYKFLEKINDFLFKTPLSLPRKPRLTWRKRESRFPIRSGMTNKDTFQAQTFGPFNLFCMKIEHGEYAKITEYIKTLWKEAKRRKLKCKPSEITFYLNNAYNPKNTPLEIALILRVKGVRREVNNLTMKQLSNDFHFKSYPKTKILAYEYSGPYEYLILVYQKLFSYVEEQKMKLSGLVFETYKYGPLNTNSKYDYETIIGFPI